MIKRGTRNISNVYAGNFTQALADIRMQDHARAYQQRGANALGVDSFEVLLYKKTISTQICTCKQTEIVPQASAVSVELPANLINPDSIVDNHITIDYSRPLFGSRHETTNLDYSSFADLSEDDDLVLGDVQEDEVRTRTEENLFSANADCGLCYRTGYVPGYTLYGWERYILATHNVASLYGYSINQSKTPHHLDKLDYREGFVAFDLFVPAFFVRAFFSVRNNHEVLDDILYLDDKVTPVDLQYLQDHAGQTVTVVVLTEEFTHVVVEYDLGHVLHANIAQMSKSLDWTTFDTLGNMNVILPPTIDEVQSTDCIYVGLRNQMLRVTDTPILRTANGVTLDWSVNTRIVQPQEPIKRVSKRFQIV